jgi:hypothetical protein
MNTTMASKNTLRRFDLNARRLMLLLALAAVVLVLAVALYISVPQGNKASAPASATGNHSYDQIEHVRSTQSQYLMSNQSNIGAPGGADCSDSPSTEQAARCLGIR